MRPAALTFTQANQRQFAALSGDFNPIHLDPVASRRMSAGEPIVHGMHVLLRALDARLTERPSGPISLAATFLHPVLAGETLRSIDREGTLALTDRRGEAVALVRLERDPSWTPATVPLHSARQHRRPTRPVARTLADLESAHGVWTLHGDRSSAAARMFPRAARTLGPSTVAAISAVSAIVGMECPGRDSLLSAVQVRLQPQSRIRELRWRVTRVDRRFGLVRLEVTGTGITAEVNAFLRRPPIGPPTVAAAARQVERSEFADQRALIVGGSRGLGAAAAVLIAAGGGLPLVTYASGKADAAALRRDARTSGCSMDTVCFDVLTDDMSALAEFAAKQRVTHLYYFATPRIFTRRHGTFDAELFDRFADFYVTRFAALCAAVRSQVDSLTVFYPSTTAIDERQVELTEYAAAKAAGESLCRSFEGGDDRLHILVTRLPRVDTDQTASPLNVPAANPVDAMLPIVRAMQRAIR